MDDDLPVRTGRARLIAALLLMGVAAVSVAAGKWVIAVVAVVLAVGSYSTGAISDDEADDWRPSTLIQWIVFVPAVALVVVARSEGWEELATRRGTVAVLILAAAYWLFVLPHPHLRRNLHRLAGHLGLR